MERDQSMMTRVVAFSRALHTAGVEVNSGNLIDLCQSFQYINLGDRRDFYAAAKLTLVSRFDDIEPFNQVFHAFWDTPVLDPDIDVPDAVIARDESRFDRRLDIVAADADLDRTRLLRWIIAWCGLSAVWFLRDDDPRADIPLTVGRLALERLAED